MQQVDGEAGDNIIVSRRKAIEHSLLVAKTLARARAAVLLLANETIGHSIAQVGAGSAYTTFLWPRSKVPYKPAESQISLKLTDARLARAARAVFGDALQGSFVRVPVAIEGDLTCSMLFSLAANVPPPDKREVRLLRAIAKKLSSDVQPLIQQFKAAELATAVALTSSEAIEAVNIDEAMRAIFDPDLKLVAISEPLRQRLGRPLEDLIGKECDDFELPDADTMHHLYLRALESGISTPEVEFSAETKGAFKQCSIRATPIRPAKATSDWLDVQVLDKTSPHLKLSTRAEANTFAEEIPSVADTTAEFLDNTLLNKRTIRSRGATNFVTVRAWRKPIKQYQIAALRAIKRGDHTALAQLAGAECSSEVSRLVGTKTFKFIVPVPCGHSPANSCFSKSLAQIMAAELGLALIDAFAHIDLKGSSHPRSNVKRPPMQLVQSVPGPAILIDDVATSGAHLAEASRLLKADGTQCFAMAWIGGDAP